MLSTQTPSADARAQRRLKGQSEGATEEGEDTAASGDAVADASLDEDIGSDPYNRTGRFERNVR